MNATTGHDLDIERFDDALRSRHDVVLDGATPVDDGGH